MLVMILQRAPTSLRGELSRWLLEPAPGVFLGNPSRRVRDELWEKAFGKVKSGTVTQIWTARNEQGFNYRQHGGPDRQITELEGLALVTRIKRSRTTKSAKKKNGPSESPDVGPHAGPSTKVTGEPDPNE